MGGAVRKDFLLFTAPVFNLQGDMCAMRWGSNLNTPAGSCLPAVNRCRLRGSVSQAFRRPVAG
jgi:hypothetical protein